MPKDSKKLNLITTLNTLLVLFAVLTPAVYLIGVHSYQGEMDAYGVSTNTFSISVYETYVYAFYTIGFFINYCTNGFVTYLNNAYHLMYVFTLLMLGTAIGLKKVPFKQWLKSKLTDRSNKVLNYFSDLAIKYHWNNHALTAVIAIAILSFYLLISAVLLLALFSILWFHIPGAAYDKTHSNTEAAIAYNSLNNCCPKNEKSKWSSCRTLTSKDGQVIYEGILVAHQGDYVGFYSEKGSFVTQIPSGAQIVTKLKSQQCPSEESEDSSTKPPLN